MDNELIILWSVFIVVQVILIFIFVKNLISFRRIKLYEKLNNDLPTMKNYKEIEELPIPIVAEFTTSTVDSVMLFEYDLSDFAVRVMQKTNKGKMYYLPRAFGFGAGMNERTMSSEYSWASHGKGKLYISHTTIELHSNMDGVAQKLIHIQRIEFDEDLYLTMHFTVKRPPVRFKLKNMNQLHDLLNNIYSMMKGPRISTAAANSRVKDTPEELKNNRPRITVRVYELKINVTLGNNLYKDAIKYFGDQYGIAKEIRRLIEEKWSPKKFRQYWTAAKYRLKKGEMIRSMLIESITHLKETGQPPYKDRIEKEKTNKK